MCGFEWACMWFSVLMGRIVVHGQCVRWYGAVLVLCMVVPRFAVVMCMVL